MSIGGRDEQRIRQTVKATEAMPLPQVRTPPQTRMPLSVLATAKQSLASMEKGSFTLMRGRPDKLSPSTTKRDAYACGSINVGSLCKLTRCSGEESEGGFWLASPCESLPVVSVPCDEFVTGNFIAPTLSISGLVDTSAGAFDGWKIANGSHQMDVVEANGLAQIGIGFPGLGTTDNLCVAQTQIATQDNGTKNSEAIRPEGILTIYAVFSRRLVSLWFVAGDNSDPQRRLSNLTLTVNARGRAIVPLVYYETPATEYPRNANGLLEEDQAYKTWDKPTGYTRTLGDFANWLDNGIFEIYPTG